MLFKEDILVTYSSITYGQSCLKRCGTRVRPRKNDGAQAARGNPTPERALKPNKMNLLIFCFSISVPPLAGTMSTRHSTAGNKKNHVH
jgi:hypothetical protein